MKYYEIGEVKKALEEGKRATKAKWNGKGMFIFKQIPAEIPLSIIPKMSSVPDSVKEFMLKEGKTLKYRNQIAIVDKDGNVDSWNPSATDLLGQDWIILD